MSNDNRVPAGVPTGGEFATGQRAENADLTAPAGVPGDEAYKMLIDLGVKVPDGMEFAVYTSMLDPDWSTPESSMGTVASFSGEHGSFNVVRLADQGFDVRSEDPYGAQEPRIELGEGEAIYHLPSALMEAIDLAGGTGGLDPRHVGKDGDRLARELGVKIPEGVRVEMDDWSATSDWTDASFYGNKVTTLTGPGGTYSVVRNGDASLWLPGEGRYVRNLEDFRSSFVDGKLPEDGDDGAQWQVNAWFEIAAGHGFIQDGEHTFHLGDAMERAAKLAKG